MASNYSPKIVTDGLVLCLDAADKNSYPGSGTTWSDLSGNGNDGTITNATFSTAGGGSMDFDGSGDYCTVSHDSSLQFNGANFHIAAWIQTTSTEGNWHGIVSKYGGTTDWWIQLNPTSRYVGFGWVGSGYLTASSNAVNDGEWHYVSCQRTGDTTGEIYVDGVLIASGTAGTAGGCASSNNVRVGWIDSISNREFDGKIAGVHILNRALSAKEVSQNFNAQRSRFSV